MSLLGKLYDSWGKERHSCKKVEKAGRHMNRVLGELVSPEVLEDMENAVYQYAAAVEKEAFAEGVKTGFSFCFECISKKSK